MNFFGDCYLLSVSNSREFWKERGAQGIPLALSGILVGWSPTLKKCVCFQTFVSGLAEVEINSLSKCHSFQLVNVSLVGGCVCIRTENCMMVSTEELSFLGFKQLSLDTNSLFADIILYLMTHVSPPPHTHTHTYPHYYFCRSLQPG